MGFGQAPFPVHPRLARALGAAAEGNRYERIAGLEELRAGALDYFCDRCGLDRDGYELLVAPGSKLLIYALLMAIDGDTVLPMPSWVSYEPQVTLLGDAPIWVPTELSDDGYRIDPGELRRTLAAARERGLRPTKMILNSPNNPTGLEIPQATHAELAEVCAEEGLFVISDEIYGLVAFDGPRPSFAKALPGGTAITTGLSKHLSLGGWRVGFGLVPKAVAGLHDALVAIASETWSSVATPIQEAALAAVAGDPEIERYVARCTAIHGAVARYVGGRLAATSIFCPRPGGAFYLWPDFEALRAELERLDVRGSEDLARRLLADYELLSLPGHAFGAAPEQLALRLSVCDYDGAEALAACPEGEDPTSRIERFASRVVAATEALERFVSDLRSSPAT